MNKYYIDLSIQNSSDIINDQNKNHVNTLKGTSDINENILEGKHYWANPINELEKQQGKAKVVHCWKPYYFPTEEQKQEVINNLKSYV